MQTTPPLSDNVDLRLRTRFTIDPSQARAISPMIYGSNQRLPNVKRFSAYRLGGNRITGYNWVNNMSNAGNDYFHASDDYLVRHLPKEQRLIPGVLLTDFHRSALRDGAYDVVSLPMAGYVAADGLGPVDEDECAPSPRWKKLVLEKPADFTLTPDNTAPEVYIDECLHFICTTEGAPDKGGIRAYMLDNEPALWAQTHARLHPDKITWQELVTRSVALATAIKKIAPQADVYGLVAYGFAEMLHLQEAPDADTYGDRYAWLIDYYLDSMRQASEQSGIRLLDVLDVHWYPEVAGQLRITEPGLNTEAAVYNRLQATRTLWQEGFRDGTWIANNYGHFLPLIPRLQASIDQYFPGTRLSFSEINFGGGEHISGAITAADYLGIFGTHDIYAAFFWPLGEENDFIGAAYNLFLDYDGKGSAFGDTSIAASSDDVVNSAIYAATHAGNNDRLHLIILNKSTQPQLASFNMPDMHRYTHALEFRLEKDSPVITRHLVLMEDVYEGNICLPPLSVAHFVLSTEG
ncbi:MAG: glycoside hydrolase family 44 protein [Chitinophaga sp.]|uniref:glycoside hydrolase family 44 protein n=1 Tax=Chitinophaga sp. TaxID=1869181 RepID=UPI001B206060|nr:glycoside hydrolase family 44 protein [Chitinophaga sp.]MBO9729956.1 glycoside hydrolase family 44 protein [Chitinophaga sp.]